jgi:hypothetical protein
MARRAELIEESDADRPLTRGRLDASRCENPLCRDDHGTLVLAPYCHPRARVNIMYIKAEGVLEITCRECDAGVARVLVAWGPQ